jgi:hypothetical protein
MYKETINSACIDCPNFYRLTDDDEGYETDRQLDGERVGCDLEWDCPFYSFGGEDEKKKN